MSSEETRIIMAELAEIKAMIRDGGSPTQPAKYPDPMSLGQACEYLNMSRRSFYREAVKVIPRAYKTGPIRYRKADLDTFKATGRCGVQYGVKRTKREAS